MKYYCDDNAKTDKIICQTFKAQLSIIDAIKKRKKRGEIALEILYTAAYCNLRDLPLATFTPIWGAKYNDSSEDLLLSSLDLLVKYQMIDTYRMGFIQMLIIHQITRSNVQLMLREQGIEEAVINRAIFLLTACLDETKYVLSNDEDSIVVKSTLKDMLPDFCSNAQHVLHHASEYKKLNKGSEKAKLESLINYFVKEKLYTKGYIYISQ